MKLSVLTFRRPEVIISDPKNTEELWRDVGHYLEKKGIVGYYTRHWIENGRLIIDFGSHTQFLAVDNMTVRDMKELHVEGKSEYNRTN